MVELLTENQINDIVRYVNTQMNISKILDEEQIQSISYLIKNIWKTDEKIRENISNQLSEIKSEIRNAVEQISIDINNLKINHERQSQKSLSDTTIEINNKMPYWFEKFHALLNSWEKDCKRDENFQLISDIGIDNLLNSESTHHSESEIFDFLKGNIHPPGVHDWHRTVIRGVLGILKTEFNEFEIIRHITNEIFQQH